MKQSTLFRQLFVANLNGNYSLRLYQVIILPLTCVFLWNCIKTCFYFSYACLIARKVALLHNFFICEAQSTCILKCKGIRSDSATIPQFGFMASLMLYLNYWMWNVNTFIHKQGMIVNQIRHHTLWLFVTFSINICKVQSTFLFHHDCNNCVLYFVKMKVIKHSNRSEFVSWILNLNFTIWCIL